MEIVAAMALLVALYGLARGRYLEIKAQDLRRIERKLDALTELLSTAAGEAPVLRASDHRVIGEPRDLRAAATRSDLSRAERKLDAIVRALGLEEKLWPAISPAVRKLWIEHRMVEAVREYRSENPRLGLREAKEILEWVLSD